jgi:hypothetical protein
MVFMDEHDDDLASEVTVDSEEETESFPVTADELDDLPGEEDSQDEPETADSEDPSEL